MWLGQRTKNERKTSGFRKDEPQVQSYEIFKSPECGVLLKDKTRLENMSITTKLQECDKVFNNKKY